MNSGLGPGFLDPVKCMICYVDSRRKLGLDEKKARSLLLRYRSRTELFFESYSVIAGSRDPLAHVKKKLNEKALILLSQLHGKLHDPDEGLKILALMNAVDVWMPWHRFSVDKLSQALSSEVVVRPPDAVESIVAARRIVILLDNAGEAVFDIAYGLYRAMEGRRVVFVAKTQPYETDVTVVEVEELVRRVATTLRLRNVGERIGVVGTGSRYPAPALGRVDPETVAVIREADVVVSKGLANYEALTEYCSIEPDKTIVVLRAKCPVIASIFDVKLGSAIVAQGYHCKSVRR